MSFQLLVNFATSHLADSNETSLNQKTKTKLVQSVNQILHRVNQLLIIFSGMEEPETGGDVKLSRLLPVELGRLVYTYLGEVQCPKTRDVFVQEYPDLRELSSLVEKKLLRTLTMDLYGYNLEDALKEYMLWVF